MNRTWLWNVKTPEKEVEGILKNPQHEKFIYFAALLLARNNDPKMVFLKLGRDLFLHHWLKIKKQMAKDQWGAERIIFWQAMYDFLQKQYKVRGISIKKEEPKKKVAPEQKRIGEQIKGYRRAVGITQGELAKQLGVTQQLVSRMEEGNYRFNLEKLVKISRILGICLWPSQQMIGTQGSPDFYVSSPGTSFSVQPDNKK